MANAKPDIARVERRDEPFGTTALGETVDAYLLDNAKGAKAKVLTYGATLAKLTVPDRLGKGRDITLGFDSIEQYEMESPYCGSTVGRVANRIANGRFELDGAKYLLAVNNGANHLHGGVQGYDKVVWHAEPFMTADGPSVRLTHTDTDGTEGYPGTVLATVVYSLTGENGLKLQYFATTDKPTPVNLTNHAYFNLKDGGKTDVLGHVVQIFAERYTPVNNLIPTGEMASVKGTPLDFTTPRAIGENIEAAGGYDHNFVLDKKPGELTKAAEVYEPESGRVMEVWTTEPGIQFYSGNFLGGMKGKNRAVYGPRHGFCLETQVFPDAVNHPHFPSCILRPGERYRQVTEYRFSVRE